eukprot:4277676-Pyramimonas_sp.AAC.1
MAAPAADPGVHAQVETPASSQDENPLAPARQNIQDPQSSIHWWKVAQDCKTQYFEPFVKDFPQGTWDRAPRRGDIRYGDFIYARRYGTSRCRAVAPPMPRHQAEGPHLGAGANTWSNY